MHLEMALPAAGNKMATMRTYQLEVWPPRINRTCSTMRFFSLLALLCLALVAAADFGSQEFRFNYGSPYRSSKESRESNEVSDESREKNSGQPSYYAKDVIHGIGPQHSFVTIDFPKPNFPEPYKPNFQPHFSRPPVQPKETQRPSEYSDNFTPPRYDPNPEQFRTPYPVKQDPRAEVSVVKTRDGKKIMTMTKPGYKMVVEEMEGNPGEKTKMVGRTVKETKSTKDAGDNGETMHQSQSYQYQVVQSESTDDKQPQRSHHQSGEDLKGIDFNHFAQPQKGYNKNFQSQFPAQFGYKQHQEFVKATQQKNPYGFQVTKAFEGLRFPVHNVH